jgi:hypothetical protein
LCGFAPVGQAERGVPVNRSSYGECDYAFGQVMLTLRTNIGLTQAGLFFGSSFVKVLVPPIVQ